MRGGDPRQRIVYRVLIDHAVEAQAERNRHQQHQRKTQPQGFACAADRGETKQDERHAGGKHDADQVGDEQQTRAQHRGGVHPAHADTDHRQGRDQGDRNRDPGQAPGNFFLGMGIGPGHA